jgi:predicted Holliday junction resolvase-like endonuclease
MSLASFLLFLFLNVVVMLNLLIAIMSDSYERVKEGEAVEALKLRAETIINEEAMMSEAEWKNKDWFPEYLEVMQATEPPEIVWSGVSGAISDLERTMGKKVETVANDLEGKIDKVASDLEDKMDEVSSKMEALRREQHTMQKEITMAVQAILKAVSAVDNAPLPSQPPQPQPQLQPEPEPEPEPEAEPEAEW